MSFYGLASLALGSLYVLGAVLMTGAAFAHVAPKTAPLRSSGGVSFAKLLPSDNSSGNNSSGDGDQGDNGSGGDQGGNGSGDDQGDNGTGNSSACSGDGDGDSQGNDSQGNDSQGGNSQGDGGSGNGSSDNQSGDLPGITAADWGNNSTGDGNDSGDGNETGDGGDGNETGDGGNSTGDGNETGDGGNDSGDGSGDGNQTGDGGGDSGGSGNCSNDPPVTFKALGLPSGSSWSVSAGSPAVTISNVTYGHVGKMVFNVTDGLLNYTITPPAGYGIERILGKGHPTQTSDMINNTTTLTIKFSPVVQLTFNEKGLPSGDTWTVSIWSSFPHGGPAGQSASNTTTASGGSITFSVVKGPWKFNITGVPTNFTAHPTHGTVGVSGHGATRHLRFHAARVVAAAPLMPADVVSRLAAVAFYGRLAL